MKKLDAEDGQSADLVRENIDGLKRLFPEIVTEDGIDFDTLRELLGEEVDDGVERYSFTWAGKREARRLAQTPSTGTLRPRPDESVDWDTTKNIFIEGDNLEVLKLLQKSYHKKVKLIYIDPPYNTGNDFIYPDDYTDNLATYLRYTGQVDEEGFKTTANAETSGRYHTRWLNMMYPRLKLARNLLRDDGVVFISIDDHEVANLRALCDEVFGPENFVATVIWQKVYTVKNSARHLSDMHDYLVVYARSKDDWNRNLLPRSKRLDATYTNPDNDPKGPWTTNAIQARNYYSRGRYEIRGPTGKVFSPPQGTYWRISKEKFEELEGAGRIWWGGDGKSVPRIKKYLAEAKSGVVPSTLWTFKAVGSTAEAKKELVESVSFEHTENVLNSVKPTRLIKRILQIATCSDGQDVVLDFFAGSAATGHAVVDLNRSDQGDRRFVLVQLPEPLPREEPAVKTIADLGKSRLRNIGGDRDDAEDQQTALAIESRAAQLDAGFRVYSLSSSNIRVWDPDAESLERDLLEHVDHIKHDRTEEDVLYELLLKFGLDLAVPTEMREVAGVPVHIVAGGALVVCLAKEITLDVIEGIGELKAELQPEVMRVVLLDAGFPDDVIKTNAVQILEQHGIDDIRSL